MFEELVKLKDPAEATDNAFTLIAPPQPVQGCVIPPVKFAFNPIETGLETEVFAETLVMLLNAVVVLTEPLFGPTIVCEIVLPLAAVPVTLKATWESFPELDNVIWRGT